MTKIGNNLPPSSALVVLNVLDNYRYWVLDNNGPRYKNLDWVGRGNINGIWHFDGYLNGYSDFNGDLPVDDDFIWLVDGDVNCSGHLDGDGTGDGHLHWNLDFDGHLLVDDDLVGLGDWDLDLAGEGLDGDGGGGGDSVSGDAVSRSWGSDSRGSNTISRCRTVASQGGAVLSVESRTSYSNRGWCTKTNWWGCFKSDRWRWGAIATEVPSLYSVDIVTRCKPHAD